MENTQRAWSIEEWCQHLPDWWREYCKCRRTCDMTRGLAGYLFDRDPWLLKQLMRHSFVVVDGWVLKRTEHYHVVVIYPWPKRVHRVLMG